MEIVLLRNAEKDLEEWKSSGNKAVLKRIRELLTSIQQTPFEGIGKPEALKHALSGKWSRRITDEHRLVYEVTSSLIKIFSLKGHY